MAAEVIDTLEIAHELRHAGLPEPQADAIARQFKKWYEADREVVVTREYLENALARQSAELRAEIADLRTEVRTEIARLERDLILKLGGIVTLAVAVVGALGVLF